MRHVEFSNPKLAGVIRIVESDDGEFFLIRRGRFRHDADEVVGRFRSEAEAEHAARQLYGITTPAQPERGEAE